jgi:c-di-GMP-binding flagellar brake protein YcgR
MQDKNKFLNPGEKINLTILDEPNGYQYLSKVEHVNDDGTIDVLVPITKNQALYIRNDTLLKVIVVRDTAIFEFKAKIINKIFGLEPLLKLSIVSDVTKIQRRNYYRLKVLKPIKVRKALNLKEKIFEEYFKASLIDLSGGGIGFTSTKELDENDIVEVNMELNSNIVNLFGRIVRKEFNNRSYKDMYLYGIHFEKITEIERNSIMRFIFEEQRKLAKKGMI